MLVLNSSEILEVSGGISSPYSESFSKRSTFDNISMIVSEVSGSVLLGSASYLAATAFLPNIIFPLTFSGIMIGGLIGDILWLHMDHVMYQRNNRA